MIWPFLGSFYLLRSLTEMAFKHTGHPWNRQKSLETCSMGPKRYFEIACTTIPPKKFEPKFTITFCDQNSFRKRQLRGGGCESRILRIRGWDQSRIANPSANPEDSRFKSEKQVANRESWGFKSEKLVPTANPQDSRFATPPWGGPLEVVISQSKPGLKYSQVKPSVGQAK